jgi:PHS family inorganic phosphate transporter-like MFS transporter
MGAILIRGIISAWKSRERALGIRLLALIPLMLLSAWISWYIPDVQYLPKSQASTEEEVAERPPPNGQLPGSIRPADRPISDAASETSSSGASVTPRPTPAVGKPGLFSRLQNIPLENIAPSPTQIDRRKRSTEGSSTR